MKRLNVKLMLMLLDLAIVVGMYMLTTILTKDYDTVSFSPRIFREDIFNILDNTFWILPIYLFSFYYFRLYSSLWRYASVEEGINVFFAILSSSALVTLLGHLFNLSLQVNEIIIANMLLFFVLVGIRYSYRILRIMLIRYAKDNKTTRTLIVGAGSAACLMIKEIKNNKYFDNKIVCLVDDNKSKVGQVVLGNKVVGTTEDLKDVVSKYRIEEIIIAMPSASKMEIKHIVDKCSKVCKRVKMLPPFYEVIDKDTFNIKKIRDVQIEDLLGRDEIKIDTDGLYDFIKGEVVLVTGGGGSIGSELCRQIINYEPKKLLIFDIYENSAYDIQNELLRSFVSKEKHPELVVLIGSVRDEQRLYEVFDEYKPTIVFHAAAHKHVPLMEVSPKEAVKNNVFGTYNVASMANQFKVKKFVLISTDKAVNPTNIMGATKRFCEMIVQAFNGVSETQYAAVRFGNVLGSNGSVIPLFKRQIAQGGPVTVTHKDIIRYFMTIPEAVQLVLQAGAFANGGEIFVLDMGEPVRILDLAEKLIRFSGFEPYTEIDIKVTGLRPGEKLFEELLMDEEGLSKTENKKIFVLTQIDATLNEINHKLNELHKLLNNRNVNLQYEFSKFIPTYHYNGKEDDLKQKAV